MADEDDKKAGGESHEDESQVDEQAAQGEKDESSQSQSASNETGEEGKKDDSADEWTPDKKRFTQFKGDTIHEYLANLEKAYGSSYEEIKKIRAEKLSDVANMDTGAAEEDSKKTKEEKKQGPQSFTDVWATQEMQRRHKEQFDSFADKHPEVNQDDELFDALDKETGRYMNYIYQSEKRIPDLAEALEFAWLRLNPNSTKEDKEEQVAAAAKNTGSASKSKSVAKEQPKPKFTDAQVEVAQKFDPSLKGKSRAEIEEVLAKYKK